MSTKESSRKDSMESYFKKLEDEKKRKKEREIEKNEKAPKIPIIYHPENISEESISEENNSDSEKTEEKE